MYGNVPNVSKSAFGFIIFHRLNFKKVNLCFIDNYIDEMRHLIGLHTNYYAIQIQKD